MKINAKYGKFLIALVILGFLQPALYAQFTFSPEGRLALGVKIWGFIKLHHTEVKTKRVNWDSVLFAHMDQIEHAVTPDEFNFEISAVIQAAGTMQLSPSPAVPENGLNVDFEWIDDNLLNTANINSLKIIRDNFVPDTNAWVFVDSNFGNNYIRMTNEDNSNLVQPLPEAKYRRLLLFRLWNLINYYFPYKKDMTISWDKSLMDLIPIFDTCSSPLSYHLAIAKLATRLNDSHAAYVKSNLLYQNWQFNISTTPPIYLKRVENKTVVARLFGSIPGISVGDILHKINGMDIDSLRMAYREYFSSSNEDAGDRNALTDMLSTYAYPEATFTVEDANGNTKEVYSDVMIPYSMFADSIYRCSWCGPKYGLTECGYGYVNMGYLQRQDVLPMYELLKNTPAIIFDVRNYPIGTLYDIAQAMFANETQFSRILIPKDEFPGDYYEVITTAGASGNMNAYKGRLYLLVNEITQSHAEFTTMLLQSFPNGRVITLGSTTAGADGNIATQALPGGINLTFTGLGVFYPDKSKTQRVGVRIDSIVTSTIKGIRNNRDEVLDAAFDCLTNVKSDYQSNDLIDLYPNPVENWISISKIKNSIQFPIQVSILNSEGKLIDQRSYTVMTDKLNIPSLEPGVYQLKVQTAHSIYAGMFIRL